MNGQRYYDNGKKKIFRSTEYKSLEYGIAMGFLTLYMLILNHLFPPKWFDVLRLEW